MRRSTGRADLVRLLAVLPPAAADRAAGLLGFSPSADRAAPPPAPRIAPPLPAPAPALAQPEPAAAAPVPFWRAETLEFTSEQELPRAAAQREPSGGLTSDELRSPRGALWRTPPPPPLAPWPRLWPVLRDALRSTAPGRRPDMTAVIQALGRGEVLRRIPRLVHQGWSARAVIWVDRSARLLPFWADQAEVYQRLRRLCGKDGLSVRLLDERAQARCQGHLLAAGSRVDLAAPVLVLGDLGMYGPPLLHERWRRTAQHLRRAGARIAALVPVPPTRWEGPTARAWGAVSWERGRPSAQEDVSREERAARLLRLVAPTALAQPGLLRALRRLLPAGQADAATEVDVWGHADVAAADVTGLVLGAEAARRRRLEFAALPAEVQGAAAGTIQRWHQALPRELYRAETLVMLALAPAAVPPQDLADARAFVGRLVETARGGGGDAAVAAALVRYGRISLSSMPDAAYAQVPALGLLWAAAFRGMPGEVAVPADLDPRALYAELEVAGEDRVYAVHQAGGDLWISPGPGAAAGSLFGWIVAARPHLYIKRAGAPAQHALSRPVAIPLVPGEDVELRTDRCAMGVRQWRRPPWAMAAGRDRFGLWAEARVEEVSFRLRWIPPGRFLMGSPEGEQGRWEDEGPQHVVELTQGVWLGETPVTQALWTAVMGANPSRFVSADRPVEQLSWEDCQVFLGKLNKIFPELGARLPTEAEWERACRGGTTTATWLGDLEILGANNAPLLDSIAWYGGNSGVDFELADGYDSKGWQEKQHEHERAGTHPVGRKAANPLGLYDMLGNVFEWCQDWHGSYRGESRINPVGPPTGSLRVIRGGSWRNVARYVRAACRYWSDPGNRSDYLGFRLAGDQGSALRQVKQEIQPEPRSGSGARGAGRDPRQASPRDAAAPPPRPPAKRTPR